MIDKIICSSNANFIRDWGTKRIIDEELLKKNKGKIITVKGTKND